jgi:hypothetical protein
MKRFATCSEDNFPLTLAYEGPVNPRPKADAREQSTHTAEETKGRSMLADLILNILVPIGAKRYLVVLTGLWLILAVFLVLLIYGVLAS